MMKPVLIISHATCEAPGYLREFLDKQSVAYRVINHDDDELGSSCIEDVAGVVFLGSPVNANDSLPWIKAEIEFIKVLLANKIPLLGICFGAQLMARALGAKVCSAADMQIGWHRVKSSQQVQTVFKDSALPAIFNAFEWHGDTFSIPADAVPLFTADCIENQGFAYKNCLALQFHPEITESMIFEWLDRYGQCLLKPTACTQSRKEVLENLKKRLSEQRLVADKLFGWWLDQVRKYAINE